MEHADEAAATKIVQGEKKPKQDDEENNAG